MQEDKVQKPVLKSVNNNRNLGLAIDEGTSTYLKEISAIPLINTQQEKDLAKKIEQGDMDAKSRLVEANLRLVVKIALNYVKPGVSLLDLVQEGNIGLMHAAKKFDFRRGVKFSTYAAFWIRQGIRKALVEKEELIPKAHHISEKLSKLNKAIQKISSEKGRNATSKELSKYLQIKEDKINELMQISKQRVLSLDVPQSENSDETPSDNLENLTDESPLKKYLFSELQDELQDLISKNLNEREQSVIRYRFGLADGRTYTLKQLSKKFNLTYQRILQIQEEALKKLKTTSYNRDLQDFLSENF